MKPFTIETDRAVYEIRFGLIQIEITGRCNMNCEHCRDAGDLRRDMDLEEIGKILRFGRQFSENFSDVTVSGGEPLMHRRFSEVLRTVKANGGEHITLTSNGSLLTEDHIEAMRSCHFEKVTLSVSLDSLDPNDHDAFRHFKGAYEKAIAAIRLIAENKSPEILLSIRMTIRPHQIESMPKLVAFAYNLGANRVSLSSIIPSGRAGGNQALWMTKIQKEQFIRNIYELRKCYPPWFRIDCNDPLKCLVRGHSDRGEGDELVFDGCAAAAVTFNVNANGNMTPCSLLNIPIMNVFGKSVEEMTEIYQASDVVKQMLDMNVKGKCGSCQLRYQCGGCRARAYALNGDYLAEDPDCWL